MKPKVLFLLPPGWAPLGKEIFASPLYDALLHSTDDYRPDEVDYFVGFRPPHGFLKSLPRLKLVISLGAGVDGFLDDPQFPKHVSLVRFKDEFICMDCAKKELRKEVEFKGRMTRAGMERLESLLTKTKDLGRIIALLSP